MPIDYARMQKSGPKLKAMLTRAQNKVDVQSRYFYVKQACKAAVTEWDAVGAWVDDWSRWQRALDDAYYQLPFASSYRTPTCPRLEEL
jgi:hypothetical protein